MFLYMLFPAEFVGIRLAVLCSRGRSDLATHYNIFLEEALNGAYVIKLLKLTSVQTFFVTLALNKKRL